MSEESGAHIGRVSQQGNYGASPARQQDAIYQNGKLVGRVVDSEVDREVNEIRFGEIYESDHLLIPDECEFQNYRIIIQRIVYASKIDKQSERKGRILRGCVAGILGYREM
ncbi:MAG: hypothetical protein M1404_00585 [Acidobacteria bacterium]|nr:hypothetical protein [Acidobacteriota bacterium]